MATIIDPRLPAIPALDVAYEERDVDYPEIQEVFVVENEGTETEYVYEDVDPFILESDSLLLPPSSITVLSQTVKVTSAGTTSVDVVIEIEDVAGAAEYERRDSV